MELNRTGARVVVSLGLALCTLSLTGCESEAASYMIDGRDHALTVFRERPWPWSARYETSIVVAHFPDCQRRHALQPVATGRGDLRLYRGDAERMFVLNQGPNWYRIDTGACALQPLSAAPAGLGPALGRFASIDGAPFRYLAEAATQPATGTAADGRGKGPMSSGSIARP